MGSCLIDEYSNTNFIGSHLPIEGWEYNVSLCCNKKRYRCLEEKMKQKFLISKYVLGPVSIC